MEMREHVVAMVCSSSGPQVAPNQPFLATIDILSSTM